MDGFSFKLVDSPSWTVKYTLMKTEASTLRCTSTDQYLLFDCHHPLEHKQGVIRTLNHWGETVPTKSEREEKEQKHTRGALKTCGYQDWICVITAKRSRADREEETTQATSLSFPVIFDKHHIPVNFKHSNTVRQKLVHLENKTTEHEESIVVYAVQCSQECTNMYIGETKQPIHKQMAQHRRASSSGQDCPLTSEGEKSFI